jgi:hypothetical protein
MPFDGQIGNLANARPARPVALKELYESSLKWAQQNRQYEHAEYRDNRPTGVGEAPRYLADIVRRAGIETCCSTTGPEANQKVAGIMLTRLNLAPPTAFIADCVTPLNTPTHP